MPAQPERPALAPGGTILVLGGTAEANALVRRLTAFEPRSRVILSLAGRTAKPTVPQGCDVRIGGFGGVAGLATFLTEENAGVLIDATHPFAAGMSRNAAEAACLAGVPRIALVRQPWTTIEGDRWIEVACLAAARDALPDDARPFLALGHQHLSPFRLRSDLEPVVRMIDPPSTPLPFVAQIVLGRPSANPVEEAALFETRGITHLVCRNSGGAASYAKIEAARRLGLPVIMIERPPLPPEPLASNVEAVIEWLAAVRI